MRKLSVFFKFITLTAALFAMPLSARAERIAEAEMPKVKYVFLFIGDGMSLPQRTAAKYYFAAQNADKMAMDSFENHAITYTHSANSLITDSAAAGTALACGAKTDNGKIGIDPEGNKLESIAALAKKSGKKVGIITSVTINHATPAAFYAHNQKRGNYYAIGLDLIASGFDFFGGGGFLKPDDKKDPSYRGDLHSLSRQAGYKIADGKEAISALKAGEGKAIALASNGALPPKIDSPDSVSLADITRKAVELLDCDSGFFIMAEGGAIDWMCHDNDIAGMLGEIADFDKAVKFAVDFAKKHPDDTLIVISADHETGGLTLGNGSAKYVKSPNFSFSKYEMQIGRISHQKRSVSAFSDALNQYVGKNPDAEFDDVKPLVEESFGLRFSGEDPMVLSESEIESLEDEFSIKEGKVSKNFTNKLVKLLCGRAGISWTGGAHTGLPVITSAYGKGSNAFSGCIDNTDVAKLLKSAVR